MRIIFEVGDKVRWNGTLHGTIEVPDKIKNSVGVVVEVRDISHVYPVVVEFPNKRETFYHQELELVE